MDATMASCNLPRARMQRAAAAARMRSYGAHVRTATASLPLASWRYHSKAGNPKCVGVRWLGADLLSASTETMANQNAEILLEISSAVAQQRMTPRVVDWRWTSRKPHK